MQNIRTALLRLAAADASIRGTILPMTRQADKWKSLPKGWDDASRKQFWETLTGDNQHKVTKCIKEMGKPDTGIDDPGAFCGALADRVLGKDWRKKASGFFLDHQRALRQVQQENPDWVLGDLKDAISSVSPRMSPDARKVQDRYWELRGGRPGRQAKAWTLEEGMEMFDQWYKSSGHWVYSSREKALKVWQTRGIENLPEYRRLKRANGDMLQYFADHPDKQERDKAKKKAAQEQTPNAVDGAAARFKDHLEVKLNEQYRMAHPSEIPPTLTLIHSNELIRVVKADGSLKREAVAFIARATGNVYPAASWDRPRPGVIANVLQTDTWRSMRMAFDQYNVPELLGQLKKLLLEKGLDETWDEIQKCRVPQKVNDAWMGLPKKERRRKAARLEALRQYPKFSTDMRALLSQVFARFQPFVKDWQRFLRELAADIQEWVENWSAVLKVMAVKVTDRDYIGWEGKQIGGYGKGDPWNPPEYEEAEVEVAGSLYVKFGTELNLRTFPRMFSQRYRALVSDARGFLQATTDLLDNSESVNMLGKLLRSSFLWWIKGDPAETIAAFDEVYDAAKEATEHGWSVSYSVKDFQVAKVQFKATPTGLLIWAEGTATMDADSPEPPEPDYDYDPGDRYDDRYDDRW